MAGFHLQTSSTLHASAGTLVFDMWPGFDHIAYRYQEEVGDLPKRDLRQTAAEIVYLSRLYSKPF